MPSESLNKSGLAIEVISNSCLLGSRAITADEVARGKFIFTFNIPPAIGDAMDWPETEFRFRTVGWANVTIHRAVLMHTRQQLRMISCRRISIFCRC